ncbi:MAG TPA: hypothetical protein VLL74_08070, partial [Methanoregula sp.]|nr:hypothetical protein [Methanoregula sp.]
MDGNEIPLPPIPEPAEMKELPGPGVPVPSAGVPVPEAAAPDGALDHAPATAAAPVNQAPSSPGSGSGFKWFLILIVGLLLVTGLSVAYYFLAHPDTQGVSVIRMEGTMVTGDYYDTETIGSEVVGRELR